MARRIRADSLRSAVTALAQTCMGDMTHTQQVTMLALQLFDGLGDLHRLGSAERDLLEYAALLHDIGWVRGWRGHHKSSLEMIVDNLLLPLDGKTRLIVGSIARYHRKALPSKKHDHYAALEETEQLLVCKLAGLLRVADGLDRTHENRVRGVRCLIDQDEVLLRCSVNGPAPEEEKAAVEKADLFTQIYRKKVTIRMVTG
jgi:exopolyphosphatase/guanosine-5'-triphosphate,3'-diphosphate pyrophosphatase